MDLKLCHGNMRITESQVPASQRHTHALNLQQILWRLYKAPPVVRHDVGPPSGIYATFRNTLNMML